MQNITHIDLTHGEFVFLFYFAFPYDIPHKLLAKITELA